MAHSGRLTPAAMALALCQWRVAKICSLMASIGPTALIADQDPAAVVVLDQRPGLGREHLEAVADRLLGVVGAVLLPGPAGQPGQQLLLLDLEVQGQVERDPLGHRPPVGGLGLGQGARVAVQDVPALLGGLGPSGPWSSRSRCRRAPGRPGPCTPWPPCPARSRWPPARGAAHRWRCSAQVEVLGDPGRLGPLARPGRADQQHAHGRSPSGRQCSRPRRRRPLPWSGGRCRGRARAGRTR